MQLLIGRVLARACMARERGGRMRMRINGEDQGGADRIECSARCSPPAHAVRSRGQWRRSASRRRRDPLLAAVPLPGRCRYCSLARGCACVVGSFLVAGSAQWRRARGGGAGGGMQTADSSSGSGVGVAFAAAGVAVRTRPVSGGSVVLRAALHGATCGVGIHR